jgi:hypothetical protein
MENALAFLPNLDFSSPQLFSSFSSTSPPYLLLIIFSSILLKFSSILLNLSSILLNFFQFSSTSPTSPQHKKMLHFPSNLIIMHNYLLWCDCDLFDSVSRSLDCFRLFSTAFECSQIHSRLPLEKLLMEEKKRKSELWEHEGVATSKKESFANNNILWESTAWCYASNESCAGNLLVTYAIIFALFAFT